MKKLCHNFLGSEQNHVQKTSLCRKKRQFINVNFMQNNSGIVQCCKFSINLPGWCKQRPTSICYSSFTLQKWKYKKEKRLRVPKFMKFLTTKK